jgi:outer membrane cobalamin receptor
MFKILLFFSMGFLLFPLMTMAHEISIKGAVYDKEANTPLTGAHIVLEGTGKSATSDVFGTYSFADLAEGSYALKVSFIGYETIRITAVVKAGETTTVASYLPTARLELSEVTVNSPVQAPMNSISGVDIKLRPTRSAQDMLRMVPGLFIAQHAGGGKAEQIFLRGFDIDHGTDINLTVDGLPVNMVSHAHGQGYSDLHFLIPETVESIDFGKGPYYSNKGDFTTAGYAGFQTRNALKKSMFKLEGGQFDTYRAVAMLDVLGEKSKEQGQSAYIASEYLFTNGYFDSPQNFNRLNLFGKYNRYIDNNKILNVSLSTFNSKWDASGQIPQRAVDAGIIGRFGAIDNTEGGNTRRSNVNIQLTSILPGGAILKNQLYFTRYDFELYSNFTFFLNDSLNGDQIRQKENRNLTGYLGSYTQKSRLFNKDLITEAGIGLRYDEIQNNELSRTKSRRITTANLALGDIDQVNAHAYLDEKLMLSPKLTLNAGLRMDAFKFAYDNHLDSTYNRQSVSKTTFSPKLNLYYDATPGLRLFFNSGIGFHSNDARVVIEQSGREILPKAYGAEVGILAKPIDKLIIHSSLWRLDLDQEFVYVGDEGIVEPSGKTRRYGLDLSLRYQFTNWLFADADLNLTRPRALATPEGENYIPLAPMLTSIGGLSFRLTNGLNGSVRYRYLGDRPANEDNSVTAHGYLLADAVLNYTRPKYEIGFSVENITNTRWKEAQFETESRLKWEQEPVSEIHFTPGTPFFLKVSLSYFF